MGIFYPIPGERRKALTGEASTGIIAVTYYLENAALMQPFALHGVIPALITPRDNARDCVDHARLAEFALHLLGTGIHGIFPTSSTGEAPLLSIDERIRVIATVAEAIAGAIPVLGNAGASSTSTSIRLAREAEAAGASHLAILPMHFAPVSPHELYGYFAAVADCVSIPTILYNYPARTNGQNISAAVAAKLARSHQVIGIKDSSGNVPNTIGYMEACGPEFAVFVGHERLILPILAMGGAGTICSAANVAPSQIVALYNAFLSGDMVAARRLQNALLPLRSLFAQGSFPAAIKASLAVLGEPVGDPFPPVMPLNSEQIKEFGPVLAKIASAS